MEKIIILKLQFVKPNDVNEFVKAANSVIGKLTVIHDDYRIDARSIMGIYSLNLSEPVILEISNYNGDEAEIIEKFSAFSIE